MRKPRGLRAGDQIRVVSPASPLKPEQTASGIALLESAGYRVTLGRHVYDRDGYLAGRDADRAADLTDAFADPDVSAVFCSRGGYGCARLLPHLDLDTIAASGKLFAGCSDVTINSWLPASGSMMHRSVMIATGPWPGNPSRVR